MNNANTCSERPFRLSVEDALAQIRDGKQIILVDDEDRENEGDLCMAAEKVSADDVNFMARYGRGLICMTATTERLHRLGLRRMIERNESSFGTNFYISFEAREGVTTGISAADRARSIQAAIDPQGCADDIVSPGHVFPLGAVEGGVLVRCGQTEGSVDLARLAGLAPAGVICEIMKDDGTMARRADLDDFAREHGLGILTVSDLVEYRLKSEHQVEMIAETCVRPAGIDADFRLIVFEASVSRTQYLALARGVLDGSDPTLVRVHRASLINDVFDVAPGIGASKNHLALSMIADAGAGVFVYILPEKIDFLSQVRRFEQSKAFEGAGGSDPLPELREFGLGAQVLRALGLSRIRLMTDNPTRIVGLSGYGIEIVERVALHG